MDLTELYIDLKQRIIGYGYYDDIEYYQNIKPCEDRQRFFCEYTWVVISSGMKNQIARKIYRRVMDALRNQVAINDVFGHKGKVRAIYEMIQEGEKIFNDYQKSENKLKFLETLPYIGKVTKYHMAKNLGFDVCKPDRHLVRISKGLNLTPEELCSRIAKATGDKISVVDVVFWRAGNLGLM